MKELHAFNGKILVERLEQTNTTTSGIAIPNSSQKKSTRACIINISHAFMSDLAGKLLINEELHIGDVVHFDQYSGREIELNNKKVIILDRKDILAVERDNNRIPDNYINTDGKII